MWRCGASEERREGGEGERGRSTGRKTTVKPSVVGFEEFDSLHSCFVAGD